MVNKKENKETGEQSVKQAVQRETWTGKFDFFLTALGYAVGLGAIWRFPYLCYKNGGGAFLIPYFICLFIIGIPMVFLEMAVGQFTSSGPMTCWTMSAMFKGLGISVNTANNYVNVYFTMVLAYSLYFLAVSINSVLPWQSCHPEWNAPNCVDGFGTSMTFNFTNCMLNATELKCNDGVCYSRYTTLGDEASCSTNRSLLKQYGYWKPVFPSQIYWTEIVLQKSSGIDDTGRIVWQLWLVLTVAWILVLLMVIKGIKVSGKLVYFTCLFPYAVLLALGIRGWTLPGAANGIKYYIYPDFSKLGRLQVWSDAAAQILFTLGVSYGGLSALASYNDFKTNVLRDAITVSLGNCGTSVFAGFVVFAYIGYLAHITGQDIDKVVQAGQGLAFVIYPFAVTTIAAAPFWSCMFFLMMLILGIDSTMGSVETFITSIFDLYPVLRRTSWMRYSSIVLIILVFYLLGFLFTLNSGSYWLELVDTFAGSWAIFLIAALECVSVGWFYGFNKFRNDMAAMLGPHIAYHFLFNIFRVLWCVVTPLIIMALFVIACLNVKLIDNFPAWTLSLGNFISASTLFGVILWALYMLVDALFIHKRPLVSLLAPGPNWRPLKEENKKLVDQIHAKFIDGRTGVLNESFEIF